MGLRFILKKHVSSIILVLGLLLFRIYLGAQVNFSHEDYFQIYLIGIENAVSGVWSYWGPDIVWSKTRLPGAMQALLIGLPLRWTGNIYSPIILSNIISAAGLVLLAVYSRQRFPSLPLNFLICLYLLAPFALFHGTVLLNTAYLIFSSALLFIAVFELFIFRDRMIFKEPSYYFLGLGFSLFFTYQLHLTWVMFLPFIVVLFTLEWKRNHVGLLKIALFFLIGCAISSLSLLPTLITYGKEIFINSGDNLTLQPERFGRVFDLLMRYFSMASFDITPSFDVIKAATDESAFELVLVWLVRLISMIQIAVLAILIFKSRTEELVKKSLLLFGLTFVMALFLFVLGNKHLSARTYILLFPIPMWLSLFAYEKLFEKPLFKNILYCGLGIVFLTFFGIAWLNRSSEYSFEASRQKIESALESKDPSVFSKRRESLMNKFN
jgi:hypothetical protein